MTDSIKGFGAKGIHQKQSQTTQLKNETRKKLEALGIDPSTVQSEAEAQQKIKEAQASSQHQIGAVSTQDNKVDYMQQTLLDAKDLAERMGIKTDGKENISELLKQIDNEISQLALKNTDDTENRQIIQELKEEYLGISSSFEQAQQGQAKIAGDMGILASQNKINAEVHVGVTKEQIMSLHQQRPHNAQESQNSKQDSENKERNPERIDVKNNQLIDNKKPNKNNIEKNKEDNKEEKEVSFLGQIKEKFTGGIFKKEDALKPIQGETVTDRQIFNNAKRIAEQLGIPADSSVGLNELLFTINNRISKLETDSTNGNNVQGNIVGIRKDFNTMYNNYMENHS